MNVGIAGLGWVTPLGSGLQEVFAKVVAGERAPVSELINPETGRTMPFIAVPAALTAHLARNPRLRRSSTISHLAVAAGLAALEDAGVTMTQEIAARTAVVFAISNGGVIYTRRFYEQIVKQGANAASPLLFPETVYNAPASHLAALLGIDGASYTLVGDASVGLTALHFAAELLEMGDADQVVVVGAEEGDWLLGEGYRTWRFMRTSLAEGAAALVLKQAGPWQLRTHPGAPFFHQREAAEALRRVLSELAGDDSFETVVSCQNGTFVDQAVDSAIRRQFPNAPQRLWCLKQHLGEAFGASTLMQTVFAALWSGQNNGGAVLVPVVGFNQQASAAIVTRVP